MILIGILFSFIYFVFIISLRFDSFILLKTMPLNEMGDFLAGIFGPLSLMWLVLGYFQQQKEIRLNTEMLKLQADELKNAVRQYEELVKVNREQMSLEKESIKQAEYRFSLENKPHLSIIRAPRVSRNGEKTSYAIQLVNSGKIATKIKFNTDPEIKWYRSTDTISMMENGKGHTLNFSFDTINEIVPKFVLTIEGLDVLSRAFSVKYVFEHSDDEYRFTQLLS